MERILMAYDPEARETGNSAMIIGVVALVLVIGGALAYWATRERDDVPGASTTTIVQQQPNPTPVPGTVVVTPPATGPDTVVVERPVVVPQTRTVERDTRTETTRVVPAPQRSGNGGGNSAAPNVTVNTNVAPPSGASGNNSGGTASGGSGGATGADSSGAGATGDAGASGTGGTGGELPPPSQ
jgi:hypothetical protein